MSTITLAKLNARANKLYDDQGTLRDWLKEFTGLQLAKLWHEYCVISEQNPNGASYDDEVYDALDFYGYWDMV